MKARTPLLLLPGLLALSVLPGCDLVRDRIVGALTGAVAGSEGVPDGWESNESGASAKRLYYQFVDERSQVRFVERLDEVPEPLRENVGFVKLDVPPPLSPSDARAARSAQVSRRGGVRVASLKSAGGGPQKVIVYYADWCGACRKAKKYLNEKGVPFEIRNVDVPAVGQELVEKTGRRSIPVIDVDGRILTGFSPAAIDALIDRA